VSRGNTQGRIFVIFCVFVALLAVLSVLGERNEPRSEVRPPVSTDEADVSLYSLLGEFTDREARARFPDPFWIHGHRSSTQRPVDEPGGWGWHRNEDHSQFVGITRRATRRMHILLDQDGPGVVTRIWSANPELAGNIVVYVDDHPSPVIDEPMADFLAGRGSIPKPLAEVRGRGATSYFPIPYRDSIVIAVAGTERPRLYYGIDYRSYEEGTQVQTYTPDHLEALHDQIEGVGEALNAPSDPQFEAVEGAVWRQEGGAAISGVRLRFAEGFDPTSLEVSIQMDGKETVGVLVGDFFGSGLGVHPFEDWDRTVTPTSMTARWVMPFERSAEVQLSGDSVEEVQLEVATSPWTWDEDSLYFLSSTHEEKGLTTRPHSDWPFSSIQGRGIYVGDTLRVVNPVQDWWGAGDERFYVDDTLVQVGTGTEDYYGYAFCSNEVFSGPFGGQPHNEQPVGENDCSQSAGHVTNTRVRLVDRVPFEMGMRFDLEIWHHAETTVDYAGTSYWYGDR
jgi:hypothetical protein